MSSTTTTFRVRSATLRDARHIAELQHATIRDALKTFASGDTTPPDIPLDQRQAFWREAIEFAEPQVHVALDGDKIVGFVGFDRSRDKGTPQTMGEIWAIYVLAAYWGKGVGLALWQAAREGLQEEGCTQVSIWLPVANTRALHFYEQAGFQREATNNKGRLEEVRLKRSLL